VVTTRRQHTLADLTELSDDDAIYDIVEGEFVVRNAPDGNHAEVLVALIDFLLTAQHAGWGRLYTGTRAVALDYPTHGTAATDVTHPDLFFVRPGRERLHGRRAWEGVPDLVIEILSPSTREEHAPGGELWKAYERNGLPEYWVVDPSERNVTKYLLVGESYVSGGHYGPAVVLREGDLLTSAVFPTVSVRLPQVFQRVRDYK
jgi:Uma2 family endonuclease